MKKPPTKDKWIQVRVTAKQLEQYKAKAAKYGLRLSAFVIDSMDRRK